MVDEWEKRRVSGRSNQEMRNTAKEEAGVAVMLSNRISKYLITVDPEGRERESGSNSEKS